MAPERDPPWVVVTMEIDDEAYRVQLLSRKPDKVYRLRKLTGQRTGAVYHARQRADGLHACECMDRQCRKRACKHLLALAQQGMIDEPVQLVGQPAPQTAPDRPAAAQRGSAP